METKKKEKSNIRMWIALSVCFLILIAGLSAFLSRKQDQNGVSRHTVTYTDIGFDTPITFQAVCTDEEFEEYSQMVRSLYLGYNALFDQYDSYTGINNVYTLNQEAYDHPVQVEDGLIVLVDLAVSVGKTNGKLDIAQGQVLSLWHDARESDTPYVPSDEAIQAALDQAGVDAIQVDEEAGTIQYLDESVQMDLGAVAKGYTTQLVKEQLEKAGLTSGYINAGGNVALIGMKSDGSDWVIGIQDPDTSGSVVQISLSEPMSIVTSGDYQRYMEVDGVRYSHIIDPDTGYPAQYVRSLSIIDEDSALADAYSTALFCMSVDEAMEFARTSGIQAIWIADKETDTAKAQPALTTDSYNIYVTDGIRDIVSLSPGI